MICYYSFTAASGNKIVATNQLMGAMPTFALYMKQSFDYLGATKDLTLKLNAGHARPISFIIQELLHYPLTFGATQNLRPF